MNGFRLNVPHVGPSIISKLVLNFYKETELIENFQADEVYESLHFEKCIAKENATGGKLAAHQFY
jgi:hypothetical protein